MKKYQYVLIPFLKWVTNFAVIMVVFNYVLVNPLGNWVDNAVGLTISALVAAAFAYWAFHQKVPADKQLAWFIGFWVIVTFLSEMTLDILTLFRPFSMLFRWEFLVQTLVELLAVLVMSRVMKRHQAYQETAEGMEG